MRLSEDAEKNADHRIAEVTDGRVELQREEVRIVRAVEGRHS
jgi:hypothetical protein